MALEAEARADLQAAIPALKEAQKALESLNKKDIDELKVFNKPPKLVQFVMESVCLLLGAKYVFVINFYGILSNTSNLGQTGKLQSQFWLT